jgi:ribosomal protein L12E/L44/L45/RPP1/RPP2
MGNRPGIGSGQVQLAQLYRSRQRADEAQKELLLVWGGLEDNPRVRDDAGVRELRRQIENRMLSFWMADHSSLTALARTDNDPKLRDTLNRFVNAIAARADDATLAAYRAALKDSDEPSVADVPATIRAQKAAARPAPATSGSAPATSTPR